MERRSVTVKAGSSRNSSAASGAARAAMTGRSVERAEEDPLPVAAEAVEGRGGQQAGSGLSRRQDREVARQQHRWRSRGSPA